MHELITLIGVLLLAAALAKASLSTTRWILLRLRLTRLAALFALLVIVVCASGYVARETP
ncbi:hypothetical protein ACN28G_14805 [Micromonospora sp. WMMA1923]|uniref:hypothetical protein n=1 Tax=Micromonospora sp. WMMA1923 TaxID=3404125 RepID=UPI003B95C2E7